MRRRTAAALLLLVSALGLLSQLRLLPQDEGVLLEVAGRPVDAAGRLLDVWQRGLRRCGDVTALAPGSPRWLEAQQVLAAYSPPSSRGARPVQLLALGSGDAEWLIAEVRWDAAAPSSTTPSSTTPSAEPAIAPLDPAIVPLARRAGALQVLGAGVWSGDTGPWFAPVFIRRVLAERLPTLPAPLRQCLDPQLKPFGG